MHGLSVDKINVIITCYDDVFGRYSIKETTMVTSTHNLPLSSF